MKKLQNVIDMTESELQKIPITELITKENVIVQFNTDEESFVARSIIIENEDWKITLTINKA